MSTRERTSSGLVEAARVNAEDRQRAVDEVCRQALKGFIGRKVTPYSMAMAEQSLRNALNEAVQAGTYVLPDGLVLDRVELGPDMRIKVFFSRADQVLVGDTVEGPRGAVEPYKTPSTPWLDLQMQAEVDATPRAVAEMGRVLPERMGGRFEAVAAELDNTNEDEPT